MRPFRFVAGVCRIFFYDLFKHLAANTCLPIEVYFVSPSPDSSIAIFLTISIYEGTHSKAYKPLDPKLELTYLNSFSHKNTRRMVWIHHFFPQLAIIRISIFDNQSKRRFTFDAKSVSNVRLITTHTILLNIFTPDNAIVPLRRTSYGREWEDVRE